MTDLESEENKARFYEKNQYVLYCTFLFAQFESHHDECTVTPTISVRGEPLDPVSPAHRNIPQFIHNHHRRDGIRCDGECDSGSH